MRFVFIVLLCAVFVFVVLLCVVFVFIVLLCVVFVFVVLLCVVFVFVVLLCVCPPAWQVLVTNNASSFHCAATDLRRKQYCHNHPLEDYLGVHGWVWLSC